MLRRIIALLITAYAIAFAFGALAAVRWPSIMMAVTATLADAAPATGFEGVNWRELGIVYGAPYFLAALSFYASAVMVSGRRHGAMTWFLFGAAAGFPCAFMVDFETGWWRDPSVGEGMVAGAGVAALLLGWAVWELRRHPSKPAKAPAAQSNPIVSTATGEAFMLVPAAPAEDPAPVRTPRAPVSAAILRQRESFAREGHRMAERRRRNW